MSVFSIILSFYAENSLVFFWSIFSFMTALSNFVQVHVIYIHWIISLIVSLRSQILTWYLFKSSFLFSTFQFLVFIYNFEFCSLNIVGNLSLIISISRIFPSSPVSAGNHSWCLTPLSISFPLTGSGTLFLKLVIGIIWGIRWW